MNNPNDYRVGDRVVIAPATYLKQKGIDVSYEIYVAGTDRIVELKMCHDDEWLVKRETGKISKDYFFLPEAAILGHSFEWGEEIEVRDYDSHNWKREKFSGYAIGHSGPVKVGGVGGGCMSYCYARPIRKEEKKDVPPRFKNDTWVVNPSHLKPYEVVDRSLYPYANKIDIDGWWACRGYGRDDVGYDFSSEYIEIPAPPTEEQQRKLGYRVTGNIVDSNSKGNTVFEKDGGWVYKSSMVIGGIVYRWKAEKIEPVEPAEPEIFWGKLDGIYYSTPNGNYEPEDIAKHYQAKYPDWEFLGFYEDNRVFSGLTCGSWHAEKQCPGGVIKLIPYAKFRRKAK